MNKIPIYFSSIKKDGKEYLIKENLYICTAKCYSKFKENENNIFFKKNDILEKINGKWRGTCKKCGHSYNDNTISCETDEDLIENILCA